jgi:hypothetical protein
LRTLQRVHALQVLEKALSWISHGFFKPVRNFDLTEAFRKYLTLNYLELGAKV